MFNCIPTSKSSTSIRSQGLDTNMDNQDGNNSLKIEPPFTAESPVAMTTESHTASQTSSGGCSSRLVRPWEMSPVKRVKTEEYSSPPTIPSPALPIVSSPVTNVSTYTSAAIRPSFQSSYQLITQHAALLEELRMLQFNPAMEGWARNTTLQYSKQIEHMEMQRYQALMLNMNSDECKHAIQTFYDTERLQLVQHLQQQIQTQKVLSTSPSLFSHSLMTPPPTPPMQRQNPSPVLVSTPVQWPSTSTSSSSETPLNISANDSAYGSFHGTPNTSPQRSPKALTIHEATPEASQQKNSSLSKQNRKFLNQIAIEGMEEWYRHNFDHPYPSDVVVQQLAKDGSVTSTQVKKWMANKRVRSFNTLSFNGSVHPKKLKRLQRQQKIFNGQLNLLMEQEGKDGKTKENHCRQKRPPLGTNAINILTEWYKIHEDNPYPSDLEKYELMQKSGLTISQIQCWLSNKRSRSSSICKVSPSYVLELFKNRPLTESNSCELTKDS